VTRHLAGYETGQFQGDATTGRPSFVGVSALSGEQFGLGDLARSSAEPRGIVEQKDDSVNGSIVCGIDGSEESVQQCASPQGLQRCSTSPIGGLTYGRSAWTTDHRWSGWPVGRRCSRGPIAPMRPPDDATSTAAGRQSRP
jgi:hypothetical protein